MKEEELAAKVVEHMLAGGWDVFQEVTAPGGRADLVGIKDGLSCIVEVKMSLSLSLLAQADNWARSRISHQVVVVVPAPKLKPFTGPSRSRSYAIGLCRNIGVGVTYYHQDYEEMFREHLPPTGFPVISKDSIANHLAPEMRDTPAGTNGGGQWTQFRKTATAMAAYVKEHPGCSAKEVVDAIEHHYANDKSARSSLRNMAVGGHVQGVVARPCGMSTQFFPEDVT